MDNGFRVYFPGQPLILAVKATLSHQIKTFNPVTRETALNMAARQGMSHKTTYILNLQRLQEVLKHLIELKPTDYLNQYIVDRRPAFPPNLSSQQWQQMTEVIEPGDQFTYVLDESLPPKKMWTSIHALIVLPGVGCVSDESLKWAEELTSLKKVDLCGTQITTRQIAALTSAVPTLEEINVHNCRSLDNGAFLNLKPGELPYLKKVGLFNTTITTRQLTALISAAPALEEINLYNCQSLDNDAFLNLKPGELPNLKKVGLSGTTLSPESLVHLLSAAPALEQINLSRCKSLFHDDFLNLKQGTLQSLKRVNLTLSDITAKQLSALLRNAPHLTSIDVSSCKALGISGFLMLETAQIKSLASLTSSELFNQLAGYFREQNEKTRRNQPGQKYPADVNLLFSDASRIPELHPDGNFLSDPLKKFEARQIFIVILLP